MKAEYETTSSTIKTDFMRKWHHNRSGKAIALDEMMESEDRDIFDVADPRSDFENSVISEMQIAAFAESTINKRLSFFYQASLLSGTRVL